MPIASPNASQRGFFTYAGEPIETTYGHSIRVQESSAAGGPHVWLFIDHEDPSLLLRPAPHLDLEQAIHLRAALDQFIQDVPTRWHDGAAMVAAAEQAVLGDGTDSTQTS